jgi:hypothetical protein
VIDRDRQELLEWRFDRAHRLTALEETGLIFLAFVVPLAIYSLMLAHLNRGRHPIMVSGTWDFAGILFAASGFLLLGGPAALTGLHEQWRLSWLLGQTRFLNGLGDSWYFWVGLCGLYFVVVVAGAAYLLWSRRNQTSIYNIDLAAFEETFSQALERCGYDWLRSRTGRILLRPREATVPGSLVATAEPLQPSQDFLPDAEPDLAAAQSRAGAWALPVNSSAAAFAAGVDVESSRALRHVTLHWLGEVRWIRPEVEAEFADRLTHLPAGENPASGVFLSLSLGLFALSFFGLLAILALRIFHLVR